MRLYCMLFCAYNGACFDTFSRYMVFRNTVYTTIMYIHTALSTYGLLWLDPAAWHCRVCLYYAVWYSHDPFRHGMIPACADRTAALITSNKREIRHLTLRRAPVDVGGLYLAKQAKSGAAEPHEICSSSCTNLWMEFGYKGKKEDRFSARDQQRIIPCCYSACHRQEHAPSRAI